MDGLLWIDMVGLLGIDMDIYIYGLNEILSK